MHQQYVVGPGGASTPGIVVPQTNTQASALGCDLDNNGEVDNQLGKVLVTLKAASQNIDIQGSVNSAFMTGTIILLMDVLYQAPLDNTTTAGLKGFLGMHDASDGLTAPTFYMGNGKFTTQMATGSGFGGEIHGGAGDFGPGEFTVMFPLVVDQPPLNAHLIHAHISGTFSATGIANGKLCGAVPADELKTTILPQVADLLSAQIKKGGATADTLAGLFDTDHSCATDPACTSPTAAGTCHCISEMEIESNSIIKTLLNPDVDLDPTKTNPFATDMNDPTYKNDGLSVGFGFNANGATFPLPQ
jgi:hypothetical protein